MASGGKKPECVQVVVRCRPMNKKETKSGCKRVVDMDCKRGQVAVRQESRKEEAPKTFTFDCIYDWNSRQQDLYDETFSSLVDSVLEGYNGTIFAYGQTGTGKTWTMEGDRSKPELKGVIPNSFKHIFDHIERSTDEQYLVRASYLEIYQEEVRDLLSKDQDKRLEMRQKPDTGVYVKDLKAFVAKNSQEIEKVMTVGNKNRSVGCTDMNEHSSRSHAIFIITVECCKVGPDGENHIHVGKLNLVDLAGSERQSKTGATGERFKEAAKINLSLSTLGNVISALVDSKSSFVPYRDSKLTRLLQDSLGGNARTVMVATVGPADYNYEETITTLRYANRAKNIKNKPKINEDPKDALLREYQDEIQKLKQELEKRGTKVGKSRRRKRKPNADGTLSAGSQEEDQDEDEEDDGDDDTEVAGSPEDAAARLKDQQAKIEEEKKALMENQEIIAEEKDKLMHKLHKRSKQVVREQETVKKLTKTIDAMQGKLLVGGKTIHDHTVEQERELEMQRRQLAEEKRREREIQQQLEKQEESTAEVVETFTSLQQEVMAKTKKLNTLYTKYESARQELDDLDRAFAEDRIDMLQTLEDLMRDIRLKDRILENFVPSDIRVRLEARTVWDEVADTWVLTEQSKDPFESIIPRPMGKPRGRSRKANSVIAPGDERYRPDNPTSMDLDMPARSTRDYEPPVIAPLLREAVAATLNEFSMPFSIDADGLTQAVAAHEARASGRSSKPRTTKKGKTATSKKALLKAVNKSAEKAPAKEFPQARGLVAQTPRFM